MKSLLIPLSASFLLSGCAMSMGKTEYACNAASGVSCMSAKEVYELGDDVKYYIGHSQKEGDALRRKEMGEMQSHETALAQVPDGPWVNGPPPDSPAAIRVPPTVMRIWVRPWEDKSGDLHMPGHVFTEIEPRKWLIGNRAVETKRRLVPLDVRQSTPAASPPRTAPAG